MFKISVPALTLCLCAGCFTAPHDPNAVSQVTSTSNNPPPVVTPNQVTPENRHQIAQALLEEMDREANQTMLNSR